MALMEYCLVNIVLGDNPVPKEIKPKDIKEREKEFAKVSFLHKNLISINFFNLI